jgi:hypothetical protein
MRLDIPEKVNINCHVFKLGWPYPICIMDMSQFHNARKILAPTFGRPASRWYFDSYNCRTITPTPRHWSGLDFKVKEARCYADARLWKPRSYAPGADFWIVFKTEKDRTLAMMLLG